jgi:hypothetical protein
MPTYLSSVKVGKALKLADRSSVTTALITGKGEPLFGEKSRGHVLQYLNMLNQIGIPLIEIQTSGYGLDEDTLSDLSVHGVTTVAVSCVSDSNNKNQEIFGKDYEDFRSVVGRIHKHGMMARLCCTMCAGYTESVESVRALIWTCKHLGIEQLSLVDVTTPENTNDQVVSEWIVDHLVDPRQLSDVFNEIRDCGKPLMLLMHGGSVYDVDGVSVCIRRCLTQDTDANELRQVIVYPNGETRYSWTLPAAKIIRGDASEQ